MSKRVIQQLDNGIRVILQEAHNAPVISFWVAYNVGSRNEPRGKTGLSHWVEHMLFKGTERFPAGVLDREIDRAGGTWNAFTGTDNTMYYETLPASRIELALEAEADRMVNAQFASEDVESERTVIISERQGSENSPTFWLMEAVRKAAFTQHGYHHDILGEMDDLHTITREQLHTHYQTHYSTGNATIVVVGAFDSATMLAQINEHFGAIPARPAPELYVQHEPEQNDERRITIERGGNTAFLSLAHRVPDGTHEDWYVLEVIDSILTGTGTGLETKTTRLHKALIKTGLAASIDGGMSETVDPYIYSLNATLTDGITHEEVERVLLDELARLSSDGVTDRELNRAKKQARASFAYSLDSVTNQAYWLAQSAMLGNINWYDEFIHRLDAVTHEDIQRVAAKYFVPEGRTVGWLIPTGVADDYDYEYEEAEV